MRPYKPVIQTKKVRVDHNTEIEVSVSIPDDIARERYLERIHRPRIGAYAHTIPNTPNMPIKPEFKEIPVNDISELEELVKERDEGELETE